MPRYSAETFGAGDQSWLGSSHALANCRTETVDISAFTKATHFPNGFIPSGTPVAKVGGVLVPYDATEATVADAGVLAGFIFTDQATDGVANLPVPLFDHGRVKVANLPVAFVAPAAEAKRANTTIVYL